jgi:hypothetical protein
MCRLVAGLISFVVLGLLGWLMRVAVQAGHYWVFPLVIVGAIVLAVIVADEEDRRDARERWHRLTSYFRQ